MKIKYLQQPCERTGERCLIKEVEDDVLWQWESADGSIDPRYISFCKEGTVYDHISSPALRGRIRDHQSLQKQDDTEGWCILL